MSGEASQQIEDSRVAQTEGLTINKIIDTMIVYAYRSRASDIHVENYEDYVQIRFRIDGVFRASSSRK